MKKLSPSQKEVYETLETGYPIGSVLVLWGSSGMGKTTILEEFHRKHGGQFINMKQFMEALDKEDNPFKIEEVFERLIMNAYKRSKLVILDDLNLLYDVVCGCSHIESYPRAKLIEGPLKTITEYLAKTGKKLVVGNDGRVSEALSNRCYYAGFKKFTVEDYKFLCTSYLGRKAKNIDYAKVHRFVPKLDGHQLRNACEWLKDDKVDTDRFIDYLRSQGMVSNVDLEEVEAVELRSLKGFDDVIESLEANIIIPLEKDALALEFGIKPKRGVLLAGPPGTGKTTVGRALAHRLRSKFFLIDGTFISGSRDFYQKIHRVFEAAKANAPSVIFIDDSDVIFEDKSDFGLYRYLLTMLDGLEGESNKRICVMMTTMDVASVPPALVRSGRIELWLETRLPNREARLQILNEQASTLPDEMKGADLDALADLSDGLTGADLRRLIEDGKLLYAYDRARELPIAALSTYFDRAIETIRDNKEKYAQAENMSRSRKEPENEYSKMMREAMSRMSMMYAGGGDDDDDD